MADIGTNEREFQSQLISWFNEILSAGRHEAIEATGETSVKDEKTQFPDVVLWKSRKEKKTVAHLELKNTKVPVDDSELLENGMQKACVLGCKYLITWNVRDAAIWDVSRGRPILVNNYPPIVAVRTIEDIHKPQAKEALRRRAREIVQDLDDLIQTGRFRPQELDAFIFSAVLKDTVEHLTPEIQKALVVKYQTDKKFKKSFQRWAREQGIQKYEDEEFFTSATKQIVYRVTGQILFYFALKRHMPELPDLDITKFDVEKTRQLLQDAFEEVRKIDYQAIYEPTLVDDIEWNQEAGETLQALLKNLAYYDFSSMPLDVIGTVFEELIPPNEQHTLGQYFTPVDLVDFINGFVLQTKEDKVFDPTCGTGTFLVRAYDRYKQLFGISDHTKLIERIWGNDIAAFPTELTAINLFIRKLDDANNYPRVIRNDFFEVDPGDIVEFPHPRLGSSGGYQMEVPVPTFEGMMGNFPYIRQELIEKAVPGYKKKLTEILAREWLAEYPELFEIPKAAQTGYSNWKESGYDDDKAGRLFEMVDIKLSGQADIYAYMFFHSAKFLKPGGRMAFLTSNSWLDVAYGYELQKFFAKKFKIIAIFESRCEPWFHSASVNTVVTVLERCDDEEEIAEHPARFVKIKKPLSEILPQEDLVLEAQQRHIDVDKMVSIIEDDTRMGKEISPGLHSYEDKNFRIRTARQKALAEELEDADETVKWGKFLRAPDVYFELMDAVGDKLVPLSEVADVRRGYTTGINEFFYLTPEKAELYGIEEEYLVPVVKSPKEIKSLVVKNDDLKYFAFVCNRSKEELRAARHMNALKYIEIGENGRTSNGTPWPETPTVRNRTHWWSLGEKELANNIWVKGYGQRLFEAYSEEPIALDQQLYYLIPHDNQNGWLNARLNCCIFLLSLELGGRVNFGDGVLWTTVDEARNYVFIPDIPVDNKALKARGELTNRPVQSIFQEVKQPDRREMDAAILKALGLDPDEWLDRIYDGLTELVRERLELPKLRDKAKKARKKRSVESVIEDLVKIYQDRIRPFPEDFCDLSKWEYIDLPQGQFERCVTNGMMSYCEALYKGEMWKYEFPTEEQALYAYYGQRPGILLLKRPKSERALVNAVQNYEKWMRKLYERIAADAVARVLSPADAETIAREVMHRLGLKRR